MRPPERRRGEFGDRGDHGGRGRGRSWDGRLRRGDMRGLLLAGLLAGPAHGYELMRRLEDQAGGRWRPSPGSVYPLLQQLEDEGLVRSQDREGRKEYELTDAGRGQADPQRLDDLTAGDSTEAGQYQQLHTEVRQLHLAVRQIGMSGDPAHLEQAAAIVRGARQALYRILAED